MTKRPTDIVNELIKKNYFEKPSLIVEAIYEAYAEGEKFAYSKIQKVAENSIVVANEMSKEVTGVRDMAIDQKNKQDKEDMRNEMKEQKQRDEEDRL